MVNNERSWSHVPLLWAAAAAFSASASSATAAGDLVGNASPPPPPPPNNNVLSFEILSAKRVHERRLREREERLRRARELKRNGVNPEDGDDDDDFFGDVGGGGGGNDEAPPAVQIDALYQGYGTHYVDLWVGTPTPQRQTVIVDTGSSVTAFPCAGCDNCGSEYHTDDYFDPAQSETFRKLTCDECLGGTCHGSGKSGYCGLHMSYAEGSSWSAYEASDWLYAGGSHAIGVPVPMDEKNGRPSLEAVEGLGGEGDTSSVMKFETYLTFGCQSSLTGLFRTQLADGIMGMSNEPNTFWDQMYKAGKIDHKQFAMCFSRQDLIDREGTGAGAMTVGGFDNRLHRTPMVYAKEVSGRSFFTVYIKKLFLRTGGGESVVADNPDQKMVQLDIDDHVLNARGVIVDSGTTDTYFTNQLGHPFRTAWKDITGTDYSNDPVKLSVEELRNLPTLILQIRGVEKEDFYGKGRDPNTIPGLAGDMEPESPNDILVAVPASHYMEYDDEKDEYTPRIYLTESSGSVLGANTMQGHDVFFDLENNRIGFAESDCDYTASIHDGMDSKTGIPADDLHANESHQVAQDNRPPIDGSPQSMVNGSDEVDASNWHKFAMLGLVAVLAQAVVAYAAWRFVKSRRSQLQSIGSIDEEDEGEEEVFSGESSPIV